MATNAGYRKQQLITFINDTLQKMKSGMSSTLNVKFVTCVTRSVFILGILYIVVTAVGFLSLHSPDEPIGDPWITIMELLILMIAPLMAISMVFVHYQTDAEYKIYSLAATLCMFVMAAVTSCVHFIVLTAGHDKTVAGQGMFSFRWPSIAYSLDILAWDWFFALAMFFGAVTFRGGRSKKTIRWLMIISGVISMAGLTGVITANMQLRNIGIIGYAVIAPVIFLLIGNALREGYKIKQTL